MTEKLRVLVLVRSDILLFVLDFKNYKSLEPGFGSDVNLLSRISYTTGVPPLRLTIDCSDERVPVISSPFRLPNYSKNSDFNVNSFCNLIHTAIPEAVQDGKFILIEPEDQEGFSDTLVPFSFAPPKGFIPNLESPKLKLPKLKVPKLNVPKLQTRINGPYRAPRVGSPRTFITSMLNKEDSSAERMEKLKKGVQKMLHFVKVLGQIDQYLSDRIRIIVDKMSKTFAE